MRRIAVLGATGLVGEQVIKVLEQRNFSVDELFAFASEKSEGSVVQFKDTEVEVLSDFESFIDKVDIVFSCLDSPLAQDIVPKFRDSAVVIDNSNAFRMAGDVPLIIPEVNPEKVKEHKGIIANPNCSTIQMLVALYPLHRQSKIKKIWVATYQSVTGQGKDALDELQYELECLLMDESINLADKRVFQHPIGNNVIPQIGSFNDEGYTSEEMKMVNETRKILDDDSIQVTATCVRVPVYVGHSEAVSVEFAAPMSPQQAKEILQDAPGVVLFKKEHTYPLPVYVAGKDDVYVGRIRKDMIFENGLAMWIVADNVRKGAALNAVQIAELL
ncbi:aspartate-semialdehyde dehydrogenase [candidate division WOR_3 bacterium SM23_60]|uniref:Aspartate-semialdehyde dehydrogenase n=1 Tax=candidate division WOR_3 bacterium SM23_60 TaxID=1703780 RepID=A0A0S8GKY4_UNCW3|nr:MAG: aspartate-semialdehyde dehydrogenase [candidate division WOR_3 bacterium SM23_60]